MTPLPTNDVIARLDAALGPHGFVRSGPATWVRKTWNTNRAVLLAEVPAGEDPVAFVAANRGAWGAAIGYVPFLYELGLQVVLVGAPGARPLVDAVDTLNNQRVLVQSVFLLDPVARDVLSARTWGQLVTGRFQDAVQAALDEALGRPTTPVPAVASPPWIWLLLVASALGAAAWFALG